MKKSDLILIGVLVVLGLVAYLVLGQVTKQSETNNGTANVYYNDKKILEIALIDGSYTVHDEDKVLGISEEESTYTVAGTNGDVVIEYKNNRVRVIDEISPRHICRYQGWSNSPLIPITCLPNNIIILVEAEKTDEDPDDITG